MRGRWLEKLWILAGISLAIHLGTAAVMRLLVPPPQYPISALQSSTLQPLVAVSPQPEFESAIIPPADTQFGETEASGDSIATLDLPDRSTSPDPRDFEQAWTSRRPSLPAQTQSGQSSKKAGALVPSGMSTELPAMSPKLVGKGGAALAKPPIQLPEVPATGDGNVAEGSEGDSQERAAQARSADGEPAPSGQSDLDPFANAEGISLVGGTKARKGRELRFARPRVDLAFRAAFTRLSDGRMFVAFRITTDARGNPRDVEILRSSGSADIDESLRLAVYSSWFGGKMPDTFDFVIGLYE